MTDGHPWHEPGYADIVSVNRSDAGIEVEFRNSDLVVLPQASLGIPSDDFRVRIEPEAALSIEITTANGEQLEVSWQRIRSAADPAFAQELRRRDSEEARRIGLRLKALREDRNLSQKDLAANVGMTAPQLSKVESGTFDLRISTVQSLVRAMGASLSDIAGPDAPEVSQKAIRSAAGRLGVRDAVDRIISHTGRGELIAVLERAFGWTKDALLRGSPSSPRLQGVSYKTVRASQKEESPYVYLAHIISRAVDAAEGLPVFTEISSDPDAIRGLALDSNGQVTFNSLLNWMWSAGIVVLPMHGRGGFSAAAWMVKDVPVIVLKETRQFVVLWLFDLAHELGHIASRHVTTAGVVDVDSPSPSKRADAQEEEANDFARRLLLPNLDDLLREVRKLARGSHLRFKGAVSTVAVAHQLSPALLGMFAAYELSEVGEHKDRWGSATNLARDEVSGRSLSQELARVTLNLERLSNIDRILLDTFVFGAELDSEDVTHQASRTRRAVSDGRDHVVG